MKKFSFIVTIFFTIIIPLLCAAADPVPAIGFIVITENLLEDFDVLKNDARLGNFNHLKNPEIQDKFDKIRVQFNEYERYAPDSVDHWSEGQQKDIASKLYTVNFLYRAYSLSENHDFRQDAEKYLQQAQNLFLAYINN